MDNWQSTFLGLKRLPRELTAFEIEAFFTFTRAERQLIEDRRRAELMLGLALQIGFLRMSGRLLDAVPMIPPALWRHLGTQFAVAAPDLASLRALYRRLPAGFATTGDFTLRHFAAPYARLMTFWCAGQNGNISDSEVITGRRGTGCTGCRPGIPPSLLTG